MPDNLNFSNKDLRGRSFKGQDLSGAYFSGADIQGFDFRGAKLLGAKFNGAKGGRKKFAHFFIVLISLPVSLFTGTLAALGSEFFFQMVMIFFRKSKVVDEQIIIVFIISIRRKQFYNYLWTFVLTLTLTFAGIFKNDGGGFVGTITIAVAYAGTFAVTFAGTMALVGTITGDWYVALAFLGVFLGAISRTFNFMWTWGLTWDNYEVILYITFAFTVIGITTILLSIYINRRAIKYEDEQFKALRRIFLCFASIGGTNFDNADLTEVDFNQANLKSTRFSKNTVLYRTSFFEAIDLQFARVSGTILDDTEVRRLLVSGDGKENLTAGKT